MASGAQSGLGSAAEEEENPRLLFPPLLPEPSQEEGSGNSLQLNVVKWVYKDKSSSFRISWGGQ